MWAQSLLLHRAFVGVHYSVAQSFIVDSITARVTNACSFKILNYLLKCRI
jgi:hypothetical protein